MKKIFIIFFSLLALSSCFFNSNKDWLTSYDSDKFSMRIPNNWEIIQNKDRILPKPRSGSIELAVTAKEEKNGFSNNLLVLSEDLKVEISPWEYVDSTSINSEKNYFEYSKIENKDITFADWQKSKVNIFEARYNNQTPKLKFLQTADICEKNKAYYLTLAIPKNITDTTKYEYMLSTFSCKK